MDYLHDKKMDIKTPLKYACPRCQGQVISHYLKFGDALNCPHCREVIAVPETAVKTGESSNMPYSWKQLRPIRLALKKLTREQMKKRFKYLYFINIFLMAFIIVIIPFLMTFPSFMNDFRSWETYWFFIFMILGAISWAIPLYVAFVTLNIWGAFIHRKYSILFALIGVVFAILTALSFDMLSYIAKTEFP